MQDPITPRQLDWEATQNKAKSMTIEMLEYAIRDCRQAGLNALAIEQSGFRVDKSQGYYSDESSVYHNELNNRLIDLYYEANPPMGSAV